MPKLEDIPGQLEKMGFKDKLLKAPQTNTQWSDHEKEVMRNPMTLQREKPLPEPLTVGRKFQNNGIVRTLNPAFFNTEVASFVEGKNENGLVNESFLITIFCAECGKQSPAIEEHYLCDSCRNS